MHISSVELILLITLISTALMAGLFFAYSCSVNPGLARLPDLNYLSAMQSINRAILNLVFFTPFLGSLVLLPLSTWALWGPVGTSGGWCLMAATLIYFTGVFGVTIAGNVPLNNTLDKLELQDASATQLAQYRAGFEKPWNRLHLVRTIGAILTLALVGAECIGHY